MPIIGADGWPQEMRGVASAAPGLFFCGLSFQYAFSSMLLAEWAGTPAHIAKHIDDRASRLSRSRGLKLFGVTSVSREAAHGRAGQEQSMSCGRLEKPTSAVTGWSP